MSLPKIDMHGNNATISMMELRSKPGEVFDLVFRGLCVRVERAGKHVGTIIPPDEEEFDARRAKLHEKTTRKKIRRQTGR
jgi:hypothetical protein